MDQWAEAVAWFARVKGWTPLPELAFAQEARCYWMKRHDHPPIGYSLVDVVHQRPTRSYIERQAMMIDDEREMQRWLDSMQDQPAIEKNTIWAAKMFYHTAMLGFGYTT